MFIMIACVGEHNEIGKNNNLLIHDKDDMTFFKTMTMHRPCVMGKNTFLSLSEPLQGRLNCVVSHNDVPGADVVIHDVKAFIEQFRKSDQEFCVIGGEQIYKLFLNHTDVIWLNRFRQEFPDADAYFPDLLPEMWFPEITYPQGLKYRQESYIRNWDVIPPQFWNDRK